MIPNFEMINSVLPARLIDAPPLPEQYNRVRRHVDCGHRRRSKFDRPTPQSVSDRRRQWSQHRAHPGAALRLEAERLLLRRVSESAACGGSTPGSGSRNHCTGSARPVASNLCHGLVIKPSRVEDEPKTPAALVVGSRGGITTNTTDADSYRPAPALGWLSVKNWHTAGRRSLAAVAESVSG